MQRVVAALTVAPGRWVPRTVRCNHDVPLLFTPGPLTTTATVKEAMQRDYGSRDTTFVEAVAEVRLGMVKLAEADPAVYTTIPMQGSGSMGVEAIVGCTTPPGGKWIVIINGAYGHRMAAILSTLKIDVITVVHEEHEPIDHVRVQAAMEANPDVTNVGIVHCETTTGVFNDLEAIRDLIAQHLPSAVYFVDAMSSFGAVPVDITALGIDYLCTSSNKCVQGVPGFSILLARIEHLRTTEGWNRSHCLNLHHQWTALESTGQFPNTPPVQAIMAYRQALRELDVEGGVQARCERYQRNQTIIRDGLKGLGFKLLLPEDHRLGWIILTFLQPQDPNWDFAKFYNMLKERGIVIYPGKLTKVDCFRIGCIGELYESHCEMLVEAVREVRDSMGLTL